MIRWLDPLFVSESAENDLQRIVKRIKHRKGLLDTYVLMLPANKSDQLDIIHANYLVQPWYQERELTIVGVARGKSNAIELLVRMVDEAVNKTGSPELRAYLEWLLIKGGGG